MKIGFLQIKQCKQETQALNKAKINSLCWEMTQLLQQSAQIPKTKPFFCSLTFILSAAKIELQRPRRLTDTILINTILSVSWLAYPPL